MNDTPGRRPRVVILGGGFAGIYAAMELEKALAKGADLEIVLVNKENYFVFQPMLPEVISGTIGILDVVSPIRRLLPRTDLHVRDVEEVDLEKKVVVTSPGFRPHAARHPFRPPGGRPRQRHRLPWPARPARARVPVQEPRRRPQPAQPRHPCPGRGGDRARRRGPAQAAPHLRGRGRRVLGRRGRGRAERLRARGRAQLPGHRRRARSGSCSCTRASASFPRSRRAWPSSRRTSWCARRRDPVRDAAWRRPPATPPSCGAASGSPPRRWSRRCRPSRIRSWRRCPWPRARTGGCSRTGTSRPKGARTCGRFGDCAVVPQADGTPSPPTAQHAIRQANVAADNIVATLHGRPLRTFDFKGLGKMGALGHRSAVAELPFGIKVSGFPAWWIWRSIYLTKLPGWGRRLRVASAWTLDLFLPPELVQLKLGGSGGVTQEHFEPGQDVFRAGRPGRPCLHRPVRGGARCGARRMVAAMPLARLGPGRLVRRDGAAQPDDAGGDACAASRPWTP